VVVEGPAGMWQNLLESGPLLQPQAMTDQPSGSTWTTSRMRRACWELQLQCCTGRVCLADGATGKGRGGGPLGGD